MAKIANIVRKALQNAGIWASDSEDVPGDYLVPCHGMLQDIVAELNAQSAIVFEQSMDSVDVIGKTLTFKPYTTAELAIIAGGGTVDTTDRLTDFIPVQPPVGVATDSCAFRMVSASDLSLLGGAASASTFAFISGYGEARMEFDGLVNDTLRLVRNVPIVVDDSVTGEVRVPSAYDHFLVTRLAEAVALRYQFSESASVFAQKSRVQENALANNVVSARPIMHRTSANLNRFRG